MGINSTFILEALSSESLQQSGLPQCFGNAFSWGKGGTCPKIYSHDTVYHRGLVYGLNHRARCPFIPALEPHPYRFDFVIVVISPYRSRNRKGHKHTQRSSYRTHLPG